MLPLPTDDDKLKTRIPAVPQNVTPRQLKEVWDELS